MKRSLLSSAVEASRRPAPEEPPQTRSDAGRQDRPIRGSPRAGLKHIGGYLDDETVEKVAILRARLKLDNSQLMKLAIEDLFDKRRAEGAFKP